MLMQSKRYRYKRRLLICAAVICGAVLVLWGIVIRQWQLKGPLLTTVTAPLYDKEFLSAEDERRYALAEASSADFPLSPGIPGRLTLRRDRLKSWINILETYEGEEAETYLRTLLAEFYEEPPIATKWVLRKLEIGDGVFQSGLEVSIISENGTKFKINGAVASIDVSVIYTSELEHEAHIAYLYYPLPNGSSTYLEVFGSKKCENVYYKIVK